MFDNDFFGLHKADLEMPNDDTLEVVDAARAAWLAVGESFANEIGRICAAKDIDGRAVMAHLAKDADASRVLEATRPGSFADSKKAAPLLSLADASNVRAPLLGSVSSSHIAQILYAAEAIERLDPKRVALLGLDRRTTERDLIDNPVLRIAYQLATRDIDVAIFDPALEALCDGPANTQAHIVRRLPNMVVDSIAEAIAGADVIVVGHDSADVRAALLNRDPDQQIIDLVRIFENGGKWAEMAEKGMTDFIQKPARPDDIQAMVEKWRPLDRPTAGLKVLVADDDRAIAEVIKATIEKLGHQVQQASSGPEAVLACLSNRFDMAFMDVNMPGLSGDEATRRIRSIDEANSTLPVIAVTGLAAPETSSTYRGICW